MRDAFEELAKVASRLRVAAVKSAAEQRRADLEWELVVLDDQLARDEGATTD